MRHASLLALVLGLSLASWSAARAEDQPPPTRPVTTRGGIEVRRVEGMCNAYLLTCVRTGDFVVVDPHAGITDAVKAAQRAGRRLVGIWITHEHGDHLSGVESMPRSSGEQPVGLVAHAETNRALDARRKRGPSPRMPRPLQLMKQGDTLSLGKTTWQVLHLPGHSPGSIGFLLAEHVLVVGDVLFRGSVGRTDLPTSDQGVFQTSLATRLWDLPASIVVLPGHGDTTTLGAEKRENWLFQDYVRAARGEPPIARPWFGIQLDVEYGGPGLKIASIVAASPAATAGLAAGDVLLVMDRVPLESTQALFGVIRRHGAGDTVPLVFRRGGVERTLDFRFGTRPPR